MNDLNPFAPPVADGPAPARAVAYSGERYFLVSRTKLAVMSLCTFGLYELWWFFRQWKMTKARTGSDIWPFARALFVLFFTHALLRDVTMTAAEVGVRPRFSVQGAAWAFIALTLLHRLPDPFWLVSLFAFVPLLAVQDTINDIHRQIAPDADPNSHFTIGNWVTIVIGGAFLALAVVGLFLPDVP